MYQLGSTRQRLATTLAANSFLVDEDANGPGQEIHYATKPPLEF
jgi:hypothetical protein